MVAPRVMAQIIVRLVPLGAAWLALLCSSAAAAQAAGEPPPPPQTEAQPDDDWQGELDPDSPLAPLPDIGVDWPDMAQPLPPLPDLPDLPQEAPVDVGQPTPGQADASGDAARLVAQPVAPIAAGEPVTVPADEGLDSTARRYRVLVDGLDGTLLAQFDRRFGALSVLRARERETANGAQINRRVAEDRQLVETLMRNAGYYDATITNRVDVDGDQALVRFGIAAGPLYRYASVDLRGADALGDGERARLITIFGIAAGDPVIADTLVEAQVRTANELRETGYPFVQVGQETVRIDHDDRSGRLDQPIDAGRRLRFGRVIADDDGLFGDDHILRIARFSSGDYYRQSDVEDLRRAIIATGVVGALTITPQENADGDHVDLSVAVTPAPLRTLAASLGYGTGEGLRAEVSWQHRSLFPPEGALLLRGIAGTREQAVGATFRRNNWRARDRVFTILAQTSNNDLPAFEAQVLQLAVSVERISTLIYQKRWTWAARAELLGTDELAFVARSGGFASRRFGIASLSGQIAYDASDHLLDPRRGYRLSLRVAPEVSLQGSVFGYARIQGDASAYLPVGGGTVLAGRVRVGSIIGAQPDRIAPSRRYYAGGGSSVRGYAFQAVGPAAPNGDPIGGTGLFELAAEARIPLFGAFSIVPFVDAGNVGAGDLPRLGDMRVGAGLGIRYATNFGPIRVDVGTPLNHRAGDSRIAVYVSLGQAF